MFLIYYEAVKTSHLGVVDMIRVINICSLWLWEEQSPKSKQTILEVDRFWGGSMYVHLQVLLKATVYLLAYSLLAC